MEQERNEEISLMDYVDAVWKRRWLVVIPTLIIVLATVIFSFLLPKIWEIDAIIQPSKFMTQTETGEFREVVVVDPRQVAGQINQRSYDNPISAELKIDPQRFPRLKAENLRDTKLVRVAVRTQDVDRGKKVLTALFNHLKNEFDKKIEVELKGIDSQIEAKKIEINENVLNIRENENQTALKKLLIQDKENEITTKESEIKKKNNELRSKDLDIKSKGIDKDRVGKEIESDRNKLKISDDRMKSILEEMKSVKARVDDLDGQLKKALAEKKQGTDAVGLLLYSNEIQQNLRYYNTLDEKLSTERITQENIFQDIRNKEEQLRQIDILINQTETEKDTILADIDDIRTEIKVVRTEIDKIYNQIETIKNDIDKIKNDSSAHENDMSLLRDKKVRLDYTQLVKEPTPSLFPVSPRKKTNALIAGTLSLMAFAILALFVDAMDKRKSRAQR